MKWYANSTQTLDQTILWTHRTLGYAYPEKSAPSNSTKFVVVIKGCTHRNWAPPLSDVPWSGFVSTPMSESRVFTLIHCFHVIMSLIVKESLINTLCITDSLCADRNRTSEFRLSIRDASLSKGAICAVNLITLWCTLRPTIC